MFYRAQGRKLGSCLFPFFAFESDYVGISHLHVSLMVKGWGSWVCSASRRDDWCLNVYQCLRGRCQDYGARLFLVVPSNRTRGNGQKLVHRSSTWTFLLCRWLSTETDCWEKLWRLPQGRYSSLDTTLCHVLWVPEQGGWIRWPTVVLSNLSHPFWNSLILWREAVTLQRDGSCPLTQTVPCLQSLWWHSPAVFFSLSPSKFNEEGKRKDRQTQFWNLNPWLWNLNPWLKSTCQITALSAVA